MVSGVALPGFPLPATLAVLPAKHVSSNWSGYVAGKPRLITAYVLEADNRSLCGIGKVELQGAPAPEGRSAADSTAPL
jgi:hypothetical protein